MKKLVISIGLLFFIVSDTQARRATKTVKSQNTAQKNDIGNNEPVRPQWGALADLALQQVIMMGQQAANSMFYEEEREEQARDFAERKEIDAQLQKMRKSLNESIKKEQEKTSALYAANYKTISENLQKASQDSLAEMNYIQRLVGKSVDNASPFFTGNPIGSDRDFAVSSTHLPPTTSTGPIWYNAMKYASAAGNWIYDVGHNGLVQCGSSFDSLFNSTNIPDLIKNTLDNMANRNLLQEKKIITRKLDPTQSIANIIFTPHYPTQAELKSGYTIRAEITLINATFPFCAGIVFNKARALPGSFERPYSFRFVGFYGDADKKVGLYAGQTTSEVSEGMPQIQSPFDKIFPQFDDTNPLKIKKRGKELYMVTDGIESLGKDPLTYILEITTGQQKISIKLFKKTDTAPTLLYASPPEGIDPSQYPATPTSGSDADTAVLAAADPAQNEAIFWYHDIGLAAICCQALFTITSPTNVMPQKK